MNKKLILTTLTATALYFVSAFPAHGNAVPEFGSCLNPQWTKTQENHGSNHGVVGTGTYAGVDTIYSSGGNVLQCLCTENGKGYQTNWLEAANLSKDTIDSMKAQGWLYVAHGDDWGLKKSPYLAKNSEYTCADCTPTPTQVSGTPTPTEKVPGPTATPGPTNKTETSVLGGLAPTGNALALYLSLLAGVLLIAAGAVFRKFSK